MDEYVGEYQCVCYKSSVFVVYMCLIKNIIIIIIISFYELATEQRPPVFVLYLPSYSIQLHSCGPVSIFIFVLFFLHLLHTPCHYHIFCQSFPSVYIYLEETVFFRFTAWLFEVRVKITREVKMLK